MRTDRQFSCWIIGAGTLPIQCAEILLRAGHEICGVVSANPSIKRWAEGRNIPHVAPGADLPAVLKPKPFDYLFSIVNEHILGEEVLALPRKLAINYHDGPLPRYAGTHATSWALLNQETSHGISWHVLSKQVDAGDILTQRRIEITPHETAFSLNTKCYEAAIEAFIVLVEELAGGGIQPVKQNLRERTFFPRYRRPARGCVIAWDRPATEIAALIRALNLGPHPNPLGAPKFLIGSEFMIPREVELLASVSGRRPGTVLSLSGSRMTVSTATNDLALGNFSTIEGRSATAEELSASHRLIVGRQLSSPDTQTCETLQALVADCCKHEAFWVERLATLQPLLLPYAKVGPTCNAASENRRLPMSLPNEVVRFLAGSAPANPGEALLAAWVAYLGRIASVESFDLGFGDASLRQRLNGVENLFATLVPWRVQLSDNQNYAGVWAAVETSLKEIRRRLTFLHDVAARYPVLAASRDQSLTWLTLPVAAEIVEQLNEARGTCKGQLCLAIARDGTGCTWQFDTGTFPQENVERMLRQFGIFLRALAAEPDRTIGRQPLMSVEELHEMLVEWNRASVEVPKHVCLHQLFEAQAQRTPDGVAVVWKQQRWSYRELNQRANKLAHHLREQGAGPETLIGICVRRSAQLLVAILGVLKAGAAYVPLDPAYPAERRRFVLNDARSSFLVTERALSADLALEIPSCKLICLDSDWETISKAPAENPESGVSANNLAYVIYTSGSTGRPKGVAIEHGSPVTLVCWAHTVFSPKECCGTLFATSICFDLSIFEMFLPLSRGGRIIVAENALELPDLPAAAEVTLVNTVPSAMRELVRMRALPSSVRTVCLAGEPLLVELVREIYKVSGVERVYDLYGPTETTTYSTWVLRRADGPYTVGRPIANTQVYLLDTHEQPVPVGIPGQIYIGGDGVARGYLNRGELTAERFVTDRFSTLPGARLYKTGDLARYSPNGDIELLGRMDHQVKLRGFRIELGEVEAVLRQCVGVRECVVVAREDLPGEKRLVAYLAGRSEELPATAELRHWMQRQLPEFMVPSAFVRLNGLPLTPNGKIDRRALPAPSARQLASPESLAAPRDSVEERLLSIWQETLGIQPIGVEDNFFHLGGDSLQAVRLFAHIEDAFRRKLPLATLLQSPTVAKLAVLLRNYETDVGSSCLVPIQPRGTKPPFFCIHARGGNVLFYRELANRLGLDQPLYGVQAQGLDGKQPYLTRVEDMAARYIREIKAIQPEGPYFLGGSSFGGTAAFEMAQQLHASGDEVALLAVFDTGGPGYPKTTPVSTFARYWQKVRNFAGRVHHYCWALRTLEPGQRLPYVRRKATKARVKYIRQFRRTVLKFARKLSPAVGQALFSSYLNARWALFEFETSIGKALDSYVHKAYPGRMTIFRASNQPLGIYPDPTLGWEPFVTGGLQIHEVPGNHGTIMVEPGVRFLAERLNACLAAAQVRARTDTAGESTADIVPARANREFSAVALHQSS